MHIVMGKKAAWGPMNRLYSRKYALVAPVGSIAAGIAAADLMSDNRRK